MKQSTVKGVTSNYTYNATGLRQSKTSGGVTTTHVYDGQNIVMDYTSTGSMQTFIRGNGLIARKIGDTKEYYHQNIHGDIVALTNINGSIIRDYRYDAFGNQLQTTTDTNPFRYCGEYTDAETGYIYLRARYYDPSLGRFTQEDPRQDTWNWYIYAGNNPVTFYDPWGLEYGKLRDFFHDYYAAFDGNAELNLGEINHKGYAQVKLGNYSRIFYFDGTIINEHRDESDTLTTETLKVADNINGTMYMQRSVFVAAMGMTQDRTATVRYSQTINVSSNLAMIDFIGNINSSISAGSDIKTIIDAVGKTPSLGNPIKTGIALYNLADKLKEGSILSEGNYRAEEVVVNSPYYKGYKFIVQTLYGIEAKTNYYQWFAKFATIPGLPPSLVN